MGRGSEAPTHAKFRCPRVDEMSLREARQGGFAHPGAGTERRPWLSFDEPQPSDIFLMLIICKSSLVITSARGRL
jgi:hypothetical protein